MAAADTEAIAAAAIAAAVDTTSIAAEDAAAISEASIAADPAPDTAQYTQHQSPQRQWL